MVKSNILTAENNTTIIVREAALMKLKMQSLVEWNFSSWYWGCESSFINEPLKIGQQLVIQKNFTTRSGCHQDP
jgi:hypothetical protein